MPTIKVGIPVSLTGQFQTQGRQALAGLQTWAEAVNREGGLKAETRRHQVEVLHYDDASLTGGASDATHRLLRDDRVDLLFGPYSTMLTAAAAQVADEYDQVLWNQGGAGDALHRPGRKLIGILTGAREYLSALPGLYLQRNPSATTFGIIRCSRGDFPRQVSDGLETAALSVGFTKSLHLEFPANQTDFSSLAQQAAAANPDLLLAVGRIHHDIALAKGLASTWQDGNRPEVAAVVAAPIDHFRAELRDDVESFVGPSQWESPPPDNAIVLPEPYFGPTPHQAVTSLRQAAAKGEIPLDYPMVQAYAAGLVAQRCLQESGSPDPQLLWQAATTLDFHTFFGRFKIDSQTGRQIGRSVFLIQWQQGRKVTIWPPEQAQGQLALHRRGR